MVKTVIANPPLGIYKNSDINIGQAFYLVHLDASVRARKLLGDEVIFPTYAFNVFGRRGDELSDPRKNAEEYRSRSSLRERLSLCSNETLSDDEPEIIYATQEIFRKLNEKRFLLRESDCFYLDTPKIAKLFSIEDLLEGVIMNSRTEKTLRRYWQNNMCEPHQVTKPTMFSISNPLGGQNIGPLFILANLWGLRYPGAEIVMAGSERNLTNYIFLRGLSQLALNGSPGMSEIYIYPQLSFAEGMVNWDLDKLTIGEFDSDFLRHSFLMSTDQGGESSIDFSRLKGGKSFVYSIGNLGKVLSSIPPCITSLGGLEQIAHFKSASFLIELGLKLKSLSNKIRLSKLECNFKLNQHQFSIEYSRLIKQASVVTPKICEKYAIN